MSTSNSERCCHGKGNPHPSDRRPRGAALGRGGGCRPGPGEVHLRQTAVGLNFIDVYHRTGLYPSGTPCRSSGMEGAGVVEAVGEGVTEVRPGDRVAYAGVPPGAYADERLIPAHRLVKLPEAIERAARRRR